jgi:hypothetical protein
LHDFRQEVSDTVLDGDALPILYLLGVKHGQEDERAKIAAEASQPTQSDVVVKLLETMRERCAHPCRSEKAELGCDCDAARQAAVILRQPKALTVTVVSAYDRKTVNTFKINPAEKTYVRPDHSMFGYVFEPEEQSE